MRRRAPETTSRFKAKITYARGLIVALLSSGALHALPLANPTEASLYTQGICWEGGHADPCNLCFNWCEAWSVRVGFYGDYVFNRHMETERDKEVDRTQLYTNAGYLVLNVCDRADVYATLGQTTIDFRGNDHAFTSLIGTRGNEVRVYFVPEFSWSIGGRLTLWDCRCFGVGIEGQYFYTHPDFDRIVGMSEGETLYIENHSATYREWQVGIGASYNFSTPCATVSVIPYMGVKWARSHLAMQGLAAEIGIIDSVTFLDMRANKLWGYVVGATMTLHDTVGVSVEARFADEKALYVNGQIRF